MNAELHRVLSELVEKCRKLADRYIYLSRQIRLNNQEAQEMQSLKQTYTEIAPLLNSGQQYNGDIVFAQGMAIYYNTKKLAEDGDEGASLIYKDMKDSLVRALTYPRMAS